MNILKRLITIIILVFVGIYAALSRTICLALFLPVYILTGKDIFKRLYEIERKWDLSWLDKNFPL